MGRKSVLLASSVMAALGNTAGAMAQSGPSNPSEQQVTERTTEEIIVTARRREENLQDVPISVTVLSGESLEKLGVTDSRALQSVTPNLTISRAAAGGHGNFITMRGLGGSEVLFGQDQTVGVYFDEVPQSRQEGSDLQAFDLGNVQVVYGPQGTLFGRNTTAGAILYTTARPTSEFEGSVRVELGNYDARWVTGVLNVPITNGLAARFAGQIKRRDGYLRDVNSGADLDNQKSEAWRASLRYESGGLTNDLILSGFHANEHRTLPASTATSPFRRPLAPFPPC